MEIGELRLVPVFVVLFVGMIAGDITAFMLGRRFGIVFFEKLGGYFSIQPEKIAKARLMVETHVGKALTFGRFIFPVRVFAPFFAGVSRVTPTRFAFFSILGCALWAVAMMVIGVLFALGYELVAPAVGKVFLWTLILGALLVWGFRSLKKVEHIYSRTHVFLLVGLVGTIIFLGKLVDNLVSGSYVRDLDAAVHSAVSNLPIGVLDSLMRGASALFGVAGVSVLTCIFAIVLVYCRKYLHTAIFLFATGVSQVLTHSLKNLLMLPRPAEAIAYLHASSFGFPSAHATAATVFFFLLLFVLHRKLNSLFLKISAPLLACAGIGIVAYSRLYLGVHWFSDVLGGIAVGVISVTISILLVELVFYLYSKSR